VVVTTVAVVLATVHYVSAEEQRSLPAADGATVRQAWEFLHRAGAQSAKRSVTTDRTTTQEACASTFNNDPTGDVSAVDVVFFGTHFDCSTRRWTFLMVAGDSWSIDEFDSIGYVLDTDRSDATGCEGGEYVVVGGWDDATGFSGGVVRTPTCDESTWSSAGDAAVSQLPSDSRGVQIEIAESQIGSPDRFWFSGAVLNTYGEADAIPDFGTVDVTRDPPPSTTSTSSAASSSSSTFVRRSTTTWRTPTTAAPTTTTTAAEPVARGYWMLQGDGAVVAFGAATSYGSTRNSCWSTPANCDLSLELAPSAGGRGYWIVQRSGRINSFGDAPPLSAVPSGVARGIVSTSVGDGAWVFSSDGCVFARGAAVDRGSMCGKPLSDEIVGMGVHPGGGGYWLLGRDGGIFSFGTAAFHGSTGAMRLNRPIVGMAPTPSGRGYWLVAADGGIFTFGDARFYGSTGAMRLNKPIIGMLAALSGEGYSLVAADGGMFSFGHAAFFGSLGASPPASGVIDARLQR
jgi:hypothetical protein